MGFDPYREEADDMIRSLVLGVPGIVALCVGFAVGDTRGWLSGLLWSVSVFFVLLALVIAVFRLRNHRKIKR